MMRATAPIFFRGEERVELQRRRVGMELRVVAEWPRSSCGSYLLRLRAAGVEHTRRIDVFPRALSRAAFIHLLDDLERSVVRVG